MSGGWDRITPEGERFFRQIAELQTKGAFVGYQSGDASDGRGVDMAQIAMWNELGTSTSPSRPFLRMSADENEGKIQAMGGKQLQTIVNGGSAEQCLKQLGAFGVTLVQEKIGSGSFAPNAPSTIAKKGSAHPLIDTGRMRQSVKYVIKGKGE